MTAIAEVFSRLATRRQDRTTSAREQIETACKRIAAGETFDPGSLDDALLVAGLSLEQFRERVEFQLRRRESIERLERLASSRTRREKGEAQLEAERKKFEEIAAAHRSRCVAIGAEIREAEAAITAAEEARYWLLELEHVPLQFRDSYSEALDRQHAAQLSLQSAKRAVREAREQIASEKGWIAQILGESAREITADPRIITKSQREALSGAAKAKAEDHELALKRWERRLAEAEAAAKTATTESEAADAAVSDIQKRILKSSV